MMRWTIAWMIACLPAFAFAKEAEQVPLPTSEDIKAAYEKADYAETLKQLGRVLSLKGKAAAGYDRYSLLMLKANTHLKLKATANAIDTLTEAEKVAKAADEKKGVADAKALSILIKRSKNLQFTPKIVVKKGGSGPIDISDLKRRPEALETLYAEEKAAVKAKVQDAEKSRTLKPIATALTAVLPLKDLELAATGKESETTETTKDLVDRAHKLMAKGLDDMVRQTQRISTRADQIITQRYQRADGFTETRTRRQGLIGNDRKDLLSMIEDCKKIIQSCKELTEGFTDDTEPFEDLEDQAKEIGERANDVLTDNYERLR